MRLGKGPGSLLSRLGSRNDMSCASICFVSSNVVAPVSCLGLPASKIVPDVARSDIVVVWGKTPRPRRGLSFCCEISKTRRRGARSWWSIRGARGSASLPIGGFR